MLFRAYAAGLTDSAVKLISEGLTEAYEAEVEVKLLDVDREMVAIRTAVEDDTVVFVCFDSVACDRVKSYENGLFKSSKFHKYEGKRSLVEYLNEEFDLSLAVPEDTQPIALSNDNDDSGVEDFAEDFDLESAGVSLEEPVEASGDSALIIQNLMAENTELLRLYEEGEYSSQPDTETSNKLFELETKVRELSGEKSLLSSKVEHYEKQIDRYKDSISRLETKIKALNTESTKRERAFSISSGKIRDYEKELSRLRTLKRSTDTLKAELDHANTSLEKYKDDKEALETRLASRDEEITGLRKQLEKVGSSEERVSILTSEVSRLNTEITKEQARTAEKVEEIADLRAQLEGTGSLDDDLADLQEDLADKDAEIKELNATILDLRIAIDNAELKDEAYHEDLEDAKNLSKIAEFDSSIMGKLSKTMLPGTTPATIDLGSSTFKNIAFVFAGSMDSSLDVYRQVKNNADSFERNRVRGLIADFSTESFADYVLETNPRKGLVQWLENGGPIQKVAVKIPWAASAELVSLASEGFINDLYLLQVDWASRLKELNESGYRVVAYMGNLSTVVGRVLYSSLAGRGMTRVYTEGNLQNLRTLSHNLSGLPRAKRTTLYFYNVLEQNKPKSIIENFKKNGDSVRVLSTVKRGRGRE